MDMEVVFTGPVGVGKTCLIQRIAYGETLDSLSTTAACCYRCDDIPNTRLYDTPGDERFSWMYDGIMQRADVIVYCVPPEESHTRNYQELNTSALVLKVHTKADTTTERYSRSSSQSNEFDTSAVTGEGVEALKARLIDERKKRCIFTVTAEQVPVPTKLRPRKANTKKQGLCQ